ncbi:MAG TPA: hypothetical protein VFY45_18490 [Baekduia sp.]|nr:hypothetical protein [Baekduia sp.]
MNNVKRLAVGAALALPLLGASPAVAANWDPQGTTLSVTQVGVATWTSDTGSSVACAHGATTLSATGAVAMNTTVTNPVQYSNCTSTGNAATALTFGTWSFTATSTTSVDLTVTSGSGIVGTFDAPITGCHIVYPSFFIANNTWNNATHTLTINSTAALTWHATNIFCRPIYGTSYRWTATYSIPGATIT